MVDDERVGTQDGGARRLFQMAFRYRIYPTPEQERYFWRNIGACRFVYNHYLHERIAAYERTQRTLKVLRRGGAGEVLRDVRGKPAYEELPNVYYDPDARPLSLFDTTHDLTSLKREVTDDDGHPWLTDVDSGALLFALRNLDAAYQNFFRRVKRGEAKAGFPKYKRRSNCGSFKVAFRKAEKVVLPRDGERLGAIILPKCGAVAARVHRPLLGSPTSATVSCKSDGRWYVSIQVKDVPIEALPERHDMVGVTTGVSQLAVTSDGEVFENPRRGKALERKLARESRRLSRKVGARKGERPSKNYEKQLKRLARVRAKVTDQRRDDIHKLTRTLVDEHGTIAIRDMAVSEMKGGGSLKGKAKRSLNRALDDSALSTVMTQLKYKSEWAGRELVVVPADYPTAQTCSKCGYKYEVLAGDMRPRWVCPACGAVHDRKLNGAVNVLEAARDILSGKPVHPVSKARKARKGKGEGELGE